MKLGVKETFVYSTMESELRKQILQGVLRYGEKLLSENDFAKKYRISRRSVREALSNLAGEQLIRSQAGRGYFVSATISSPVQSDVKNIVLILPEIDNAFMNELSHGIQKAVEGFSCNLIFQSSSQQHKKEKQNIKHWLSQNIDGMIIFPMAGNHNTDVIFKLKQCKIPFVLIDRFFNDIDTDYVVVDNYSGAKQAMECLISKGYRRIAHLMGSNTTSNLGRYEGYRDGLAAGGLVYDPDLVIRMPVDFATTENVGPDVVYGREAMKELLNKGVAADAVFACNDNIAVGAMQTLRENGIRVPEDMAVVGFDDLKIASVLDVPLTTVHQPKEEIGRETVNLLLRKIREKKENISSSENVHVVLGTELIVRKSVGTPGKK